MSDLDKHYKFSYRGIKLDPYRIFKTYGIGDPVQQHVAKKALRAGQGGKCLEQDIDEIILSCQRWKEMLQEDKAEAERDFNDRENCTLDSIRKAAMLTRGDQNEV